MSPSKPNTRNKAHERKSARMAALCLFFLLGLLVFVPDGFANKKIVRYPRPEKKEATKTEKNQRAESENNRTTKEEANRNNRVGRPVDKTKNDFGKKNDGIGPRSESRKNAEAERYAEIEKYTESEILIILYVPRLGNIEIPAILYEQDVYLPVKDIFDFLKIKSQYSQNLDSVSGFFIHPNAEFLIDNVESEIFYQDQIYHLNHDDIIQTESGLFLKIQQFGEVFGLECSFNVRSLSVTLTTKLDLPAIREMQNELMRKNINELKGEKKADSLVNRKFSIFKLGMVDWKLNSTQVDGKNKQVNLGLAVGGVVLGGEAFARFNINSAEKIDVSSGNFNWRYVNNNGTLAKQVTLGQLASRTVKTLTSPIYGAQVTNAATKFKRSYGSYTLTDKSEPGWTIELYINNVLVNYTKADAQGVFVFEVPLVYGTSIIKLRHLGPWGEEKTTEQETNIPYSFVQLHHFEYTLAAGFLGDSTNAFFSRSAFNFGLSKFMTIGGGMEYLSGFGNAPSMPYLTTSIRLSKDVLLAAEITQNVQSKYNLNFRPFGNVHVEMNYTRYEKNQKAIRFNFGEERKLVISKPLKIGKSSVFSRFTMSQIVSSTSTTTQSELMFTGKVLGINTNLTTNAIISNSEIKSLNSRLSSHFRLPWRIKATTQVQYDVRQNNINMIGGAFEKSFGKNYQLAFNYQNNINNQNQSFALTFRTRLNFAQSILSVSQAGGVFTTSQNLNGGLIFNEHTNSVKAIANSTVGRGGVVVYSFLDLNGNGKRDKDEPKLAGLKLKINGGVLENNRKDSTIIITGLEAFSHYLIEVNNKGFDNISWRLKYKSFDIEASSNQMVVLEVPVLVMGEVSGNVVMTSMGQEKGLARILVNIYDDQDNLVVKTLAESDGYFTYLGLAPGNYVARVDAQQLASLHMISLTEDIPFTIQKTRQGDIVEGLSFDIRRLER